MNVSIETLTGLERRLTIAIDSDAFEEQITARLQSARGQVKIPGFRWQGANKRSQAPLWRCSTSRSGRRNDAKQFYDRSSTGRYESGQLAKT